jgi:RNA polymerase sigma-70 factor, ECF subfamily
LSVGATISILKRVGNGEPDAVRQCLDRYGALVWSLAQRFLGNTTDAEDATQEIFVDLWKNAAKYDESKSQESTFVTMIARRRLIDYRRRSGRIFTSDAIMDEIPARELRLTQSQLETIEDAEKAMIALGELEPEEARRVVHLAVVLGLTHREIAEQTGIPLGTIKSHIRRGLCKVRERFLRMEERS